MNFKNPKFGNSFTIDTGVTIQRSLDGSLLVDTHRNQLQGFHYEFSGMTLEEKNAFLEYVVASAGQEITMTDHEGVVWRGFITDKEPTTRCLKRNCDYYAAFSFEGVRVG